MKEKKKLKLSDVVITSLGAILWILLACFHRQILANTTALIMMICFAITWSIDAVFKIVKYLKQKKDVG